MFTASCSRRTPRSLAVQLRAVLFTVALSRGDAATTRRAGIELEGDWEAPLVAAGKSALEYRFFRNVDGSLRLDYMPKQNVVVCACARCGMTSLYHFVYEQEFGRPWAHTGRPFVHQTTSFRWEKQFEAVRAAERQNRVMHGAFSFALIRDPKERLVSAWKSKVACNQANTGVDMADRATIVPELRRLQGRDPNITCLSLEDFLSALRAIHQQGKASLLNIHFLPQTLGCFSRFPPSMWSQVATIKNSMATGALARKMSNYSAHIHPPLAHRSKAPPIVITPRAAQLLDEVTEDEYEKLADVIPNPGPTRPTRAASTKARQGGKPHPASAMQQNTPAWTLVSPPTAEPPAGASDEIPQPPAPLPEEFRRTPAQARLDYLPGQNVVVCSCAKCGSTSLYRFLYQSEFGQNWPYSGRPFLQETTSPRWDNRVVSLHTAASQADIMQKAFSFALVRDPRERLISAWKSKVACDGEHTGVNVEDRATIVPELLRLAGMKTARVTCLPFDKFVSALYQVHTKGRAMYLNNHFRPQDTWCFQNFPVVHWSVVTNIKADRPFETLLQHLHNDSSNIADLKPGHRSSTTEVHPSAKVSFLLDQITANEYKVLKPFLAPAFAARDASPDQPDSLPVGNEQWSTAASPASPTRFGAAISFNFAPKVFYTQTQASATHEDAGVDQPLQQATAVSWKPPVHAEEAKAYKFHVKYLPKYNLVVCACSECGAASIYDYIYEHETGHPWHYIGKPFTSQTSSPRWMGRWQAIYNPQAMDNTMRKAHSLVWVRDPVERLIAAWESKVACDRAKTGVDKKERAMIVPELRRLQARSTNITCLSFPDFVRALRTIHTAGKASMLNAHFLPQNQECFDRFPAQTWSEVIDAKREDALGPLADALGDRNHSRQLYVGSRRAPNALRARLAKMPQRVRQILTEITRPEYEALGMYLDP